MSNIHISIRDKLPQYEPATLICGNSDYRIVWELDGEWAAYDTKTMRVCLADGTYQDVLFQGTEAALPVLTVPGWISVGLYAGDVHTSQGAELRVLPSITTAGGVAAAPAEDVYNQIMGLLNSTQGLSARQIAALDALFKIAIYKEDASTAYCAFRAAFGLDKALDEGGDSSSGGGSGESGGGEEPGGTMYTITNALTNASTSNSAASIAEGASYSATITADSGYTISSVTVTMGGVDVTADVYAGGVVTIPSVTGAVEIVVLTAENSTSGDAELITDGLMAFFDLRNRTAAAGNSSTGFYHEATIGQGRLYSWSATGGDGSEYGSTANGTYCSGESYNAYQFGTSFTMIVKGYSTGNLSTLGIAGWASPSNYGGIISGKYYKSDGSTASTEGTTVSKTTGYSIFSLCVNAAQCKIFRDGNLVLQLDGTDYDDFAKWYDQFGGFGNRWNNAALNVAAAFYTRALSDVEIVEMDEYLKTLEVDA